MTSVRDSESRRLTIDVATASRRSVPTWRRSYRPGRLGAALGGLLGAGTLWAVIIVARPQGTVLVVAAAVLVLTLPTAQRLDRRLAVNLAIVLGWLPMIGWLPVSAVPGGRMALCLAVAGGYTIGRGGWPGLGGARALVPHTRWSDLLIVATGAFAGWIAWPLLAASSAPAALSTLMSGWDQAAHASMFLDQRSNGAAPQLASVWHAEASGTFDHYPQWLHSLLALLAELTGGPSAGSINSELMLFAHLQWVLFVLIAMFAAATAMQRLPYSASVAAPLLATATVCSLVLGVPGAQSLFQGHVTFIVAAVAAAAIVPLSPGVESHRPVVFVAICGLLVVAASWMLLFPLALAAACPALISAVRGVRRRALLRLVVLGSPAVASIVILCWISVSGGNATALDAGGALIRPTLLSAFAVPVVVGCVSWRVARRRSGSNHRAGSLAGVRTVAGMSAVGLAELAALAGYQWGTKGVLDYYWWKLALATQLILLLSAAPILFGALASYTMAGAAPTRRRRATSWSLASLCILGLGTLGESPPIPSIAWSTGTHAALQAEATRQAPIARALLIMSTMPSGGTVQATVIAYRPGDPTGANIDEWLHTLTRTRTLHQAAQEGVLAAHPGQPVAVARQLLEVPGSQIFVTDPEIAARIESAVPGAAGRVTVVRP